MQIWNSLYCSRLHYYLKSNGSFIILLLLSIQPVYRKKKKSLSNFSWGISLISMHSAAQTMQGTQFKLKVNISIIYQLSETWRQKTREALSLFSIWKHIQNSFILLNEKLNTSLKKFLLPYPLLFLTCSLLKAYT